jgi:hypothetical protein
MLLPYSIPREILMSSRPMRPVLPSLFGRICARAG